MRFINSLLMAVLLPSCGWNSSQSAKSVAVSRSALYDPPMITLIDGQVYEFKEGQVTGNGQVFYSRYRYMRAIVIGK